MQATDKALPLDEGHRAFVISMLRRMPGSISSPLLADPAIRADLKLPVEDSLRVFDQRFARTALLAALREVADGHAAKLMSINGAVAIEQSWLETDGTAVLAVGDQGARFPNVGLLSGNPETRSATLDALLAAEDMGVEHEARLKALTADGPLSEDVFVDLETWVEATPKAIYRRLHAEAGEGVTFDTLVPTDRTFFETLLGVSPPATLGRYRAAWLSSSASLDPKRRAKWIALTAPIALLKGGLVVPATGGLDRSVRLRLARFLAGAPDPLSQLAGFQIAAADHADPEFRAIGDEVLPRLLDRSNESTEASLSFLAAALILTGTVVARRRTLEGWPVYAKRLAHVLHASLLARTFGNGKIDVEDMQRLVGRPLAQNFRLVEHCDARTAPYGLWSPPAARRLHSLIVSRIGQTLADVPQDELPTAWAETLDAAMQRIASSPDALFYLAPGPLDPFEDEWTGLLDSTSEAIDDAVALLAAASDEQRSLSDLFNLAVAFDVGLPHRAAFADHLPDFLKSMSDDLFTLAADVALQLVARWKLPGVADAIIDICLSRARSGTIKDPTAGPRLSLLGAASNDDAETWARKAGEYMNGFAFALPPGAEIANMIAALELVCDFSPALEAALAPAKSYATLANNSVVA